ncbi:MAG: C25 family cysteine peptidase [Candidatus Wallbacteria bacterium]|nr:C25 family cysteine peptidase [Candidatus Wallbacteria bacterium]
MNRNLKILAAFCILAGLTVWISWNSPLFLQTDSRNTDLATAAGQSSRNFWISGSENTPGFLKDNQLTVIHYNAALDSYLVCCSLQPEKMEILLNSAGICFETDWPVALAGEASSHEWVDELAGFSPGTGEAVLAAVLDTGYGAGTAPGSYDFTRMHSGAADDNGHGTAISTLIESFGGARILPLKVLNSEGRGMLSSTINAIVYAADSGSRIINLSMGGYHDSVLLERAVEYATKRGCAVVGAAGNDGLKADFFPAACRGALAVSSLSRSLYLSQFSNYGDYVDFCAPGEGIFSSSGETKIECRGTSYAAAVFSGLLSSLMQRGFVSFPFPENLEKFCLDLGAPGRDELYGYGFLQIPSTPPPAVQTGITATGPAVVPAVPDSGSTIVREYRLDISQPEVSGEGGRFEISGFGSLLRPGYPQLPYRVFYYEVPEAAESIEVSAEPLGSYGFMNAQGIRVAERPIRFGEFPAALLPVRLPAVYPEEAWRFDGIRNIGWHKLAALSIMPLRYLSPGGDLEFTPSYLVRLSYRLPEISSQSLTEFSQRDEKLASELIQNYGELQPQFKAEGISGYQYLIVTDASLVQALEPLCEWKTRKGLKARIVTMGEVRSAYTGADDQEKLRNCLIDYYNNGNGIRWVLLAGDINLVPARNFADPHWDDDSQVLGMLGFHDNQVPSDYYYAKLLGIWDDNGINSNGWLAEVYVGRLPASGLSDMQTMVNNILNYEKSPPSGTWLKRAVLAGAFSNHQNADWARTDDATQMEKFLSDGLLSGLDYTRVYQDTGLDPTKFSHEVSLTGPNFLDEIGRGEIYLNWASHGWADSVVYKIWTNDNNHNSLEDENESNDQVFFRTSNIPMNGAKKPLVYSDSCLTGAFDWSAEDCLGEMVIKKLGVGFIGASRTSYYAPGWVKPEDGVSQSQNYYFVRQLFQQQSYRPGEALYISKNYYTAQFDVSRKAVKDDDIGGYDRKNLHDFNLLGDPELPVFTAEPVTFEVTHAGGCGIGQQNLTVTVKSGAAVSGATVCLSKSGEIYLVGTTDDSGQAYFNFNAVSQGTIFVTTTRHNSIPAETTVLIGNTPPPAPELDSPQDNAIFTVANATLKLSNVVDVDGDAVLYEFWLSSDEAFTAHKMESGLLTQESGSTTSWSISGLQDGVQYYWKGRAYDGRSYSGWSLSRRIKYVMHDTTPPADVSGLAARPTDCKAYLSWQNPGDADFSGVKIIRKPDSAPAGMDDGEELFSGPVDNFTNGGLSNGRTYYYRLFTYDLYGNYSAGVSVAVVPVDNVPPEVPTNFVAASGVDRVSLSWVNPVRDFEGIKILRKTVTPPSGYDDGDVVYSGWGVSYPDTGLTAGTMYYYMIYSYDYAGNKSTLVSRKAAPYTAIPSKSTSHCHFSGQLPGGCIGDTLFAKDRDNITCGETTLTADGSYSINVYGDDIATPLDEGPAEGEGLSLYLNGSLVKGAANPVWHSGTDTTYDITGSTSRTLTYMLERGWNMLSINFQLENNSLVNALSPISGKFDKVLCWTGPYSGYTVYDAQFPQYASLTTLEPGHGYWIRLTVSNCTLDLSGGAVATVVNHLERGWNMIGYPGEQSVPLETALSGISGKYDKVLCWYGPYEGYKVYDVQYSQFASLTTLEPGRAYWIRLTEAEADLTLGD